jgi:hypothetical protein
MDSEAALLTAKMLTEAGNPAIERIEDDDDDSEDNTES